MKSCSDFDANRFLNKVSPVFYYSVAFVWISLFYILNTVQYSKWLFYSSYDNHRRQNSQFIRVGWIMKFYIRQLIPLGN